MKEITRTKTVEEVVGYKTDDGQFFKTKEEAERYEGTAEYAINTQFAELMIDEPFAECNIYENFGYGSDEYMYCVIEMKNEADLRTALMFQKNRCDNLINVKNFNSSMIGKKILVALGNENWDMVCIPIGTYKELVDYFAWEVKKYFEKEEKKDAS